ncbi:hypothetical protein [uncultured Kordia sp.]|uniref:hypothetical protein n=1 Tax=uncultured Kordia sp. TaxID=507699 RepID=UPI002636F4F8|nr:hypothetical protein [uncultured Kordia sp.]
MLKNLLELEGINPLQKQQQQKINGRGLNRKGCVCVLYNELNRCIVYDCSNVPHDQ